LSYQMDVEQKAIEKRLWNALEEALKNSSFGSMQWLLSEDMGLYFKVLDELVDFHERRGDIRETLLGFEALNSYIVVTRGLNMLLGKALNSQQRNQILAQLARVEGMMDDIIAEGYTKMHSNEEGDYNA
jgi:hypothetical protein